MCLCVILGLLAGTLFDDNWPNDRKKMKLSSWQAGNVNQEKQSPGSLTINTGPYSMKDRVTKTAAWSEVKCFFACSLQLASTSPRDDFVYLVNTERVSDCDLHKTRCSFISHFPMNRKVLLCIFQEDCAKHLPRCLLLLLLSRYRIPSQV